MSTLDSGVPLPDDDDVELELEALALRRRRKLPRVTLVLCVAIVGAGAFIGGAEAQKHLNSSSSTGGGGNGAALASRFGGTGRGGGATLGGGATVGTVTAIKGSTLYVTDASGNTVKVSTSAASRVTKTVTGSLKDVHPGDTIVVQGSTGSKGTIAARSITLGGAGLGAAVSPGSSANSGVTGFGFTPKGGGG
jgi:hypothetical protein